MNPRRAEAGFLKSKPSRILTAVLLLQAAILYGVTRDEFQPVIRPLAEVPRQIGEWRLAREGVVEPEVQAVLRADDLLTRTYVDVGSRAGVHMFVAFFRSQRSGRAPHSPRNCLPGNGWVPSVADTTTIDIPGRGPINVNRYIVARGDNKSAVLYWYQSRDRVVASEYWAKFYVVADAMRHNRTDTALVRITVPVINGDEAAALKSATNFVQTVFPVLSSHLPS